MQAPNPLQPSLFSPFDEDLLTPIIEPPHNGKRASIEERFDAFHRLNPHIYQMLRRAALQMKNAGHKRWSTRDAWGVLRWQHTVVTQSADGYKLNNDFTRPYAELLMQDPLLAGFFETRKRNGKGEGE